jgi:hypothetical protein
LAASTTTDKLQPALLGGAVMGVLSALPIVSAGNVCCCLWVVAGGVVAAYLLQQNQTQPITPADGALVGFLAGIIGAVVTVALSIPITFLARPFEQEILERLAEMTGVEPQAVEWNLATAVAAIVLGGAVMLVIGAVFSTLGGLAGAALFRKPDQPPVIDIPRSE